MKTRDELVEKIMQNANAECTEIICHAEGVSKYILRHFPNEIPDRFYESVVGTGESALFGKLRPPETTGAMMLGRLEAFKNE